MVQKEDRTANPAPGPAYASLRERKQQNQTDDDQRRGDSRPSRFLSKRNQLHTWIPNTLLKMKPAINETTKNNTIQFHSIHAKLMTRGG